jgi:hypothetical protein
MRKLKRNILYIFYIFCRVSVTELQPNFSGNAAEAGCENHTPASFMARSPIERGRIVFSPPAPNDENIT